MSEQNLERGGPAKSVADPFDADPVRIMHVASMQIRIRAFKTLKKCSTRLVHISYILACHLQIDPDPAYHFDADPDLAYHLMRIRILPFIKMRNRIRNTAWKNKSVSTILIIGKEENGFLR